MKIKAANIILGISTLAAVGLSLLFPLPASASSVTLSLSPSTGTFVVDSTFDVAVILDTAGQSVNAVELGIKFPADKLQLVSSSTGKSIIGIWPTPPKFNNQTGTLSLTGGIPNGITASNGLVTTLTFRVKAVGSAVLKINYSKVLSNDGSGTELPVGTEDGIYHLILPPPAGPVIASDTHPDQNNWYKTDTVSLSWGDEGGLEGFSYMVSDIAIDIPDDISEGVKQSVVYTKLADGRHYFHIKGLRNGVWGGTSHFAFNIDKTPPAEFDPEIIPKARTTRTQPVIQFATTDVTSGIDHYEIKILPLQSLSTDKNLGQQLFIEATSPFVTNELEFGKYDVIIRAFDQAGNFREHTERMEIVPQILRSIGDRGLEFKSATVIPWPAVWIAMALLLIVLIAFAYLLKRRHDLLKQRLEQNHIPLNLQEQLTELQRYREKYGTMMLAFLALGLSLFWSGPVFAQDSSSVMSPPLITTVNKDLSNDELFYAGGFTETPNTEVILFLQNLQTGETQQFYIHSNQKGEWFYTHNSFLNAGEYELWGQTRTGAAMSPPGPQITLHVEKKVFQFGGSKFSLPMVYLIMLSAALILLLLLVIFVVYHFRKIRKKSRLFARQILEVEASIKRGFALLNRDIQAELAGLQNSKTRMTVKEKLREQQLLHDLEEIEQYLAKEIWELEQTEIA